MADNVFPLRPSGPTRVEAESLIRELAEDSANIIIVPHCSEAMRERDVTMRHLLLTLREGHVVGRPSIDEYGDWRCQLKKRCSGRRVTVIAGIHDRRELYVITTY